MHTGGASGASRSPTMWHVLPGQTLRHRVWDDECVLYNDVSGNTHLLDPNALLILQALQARPLALADLCSALEAGPDAEAEIAALLEQLATIELVELRPC